jgi:transcriptional regulator with XRE-family HTH domain
MISQKLKAAIKLSSVPAYKIAQEAGLDPSTLSKMICGITRIKPGDDRIVRVGQILGVQPNECFEKESEEQRKIIPLNPSE